MSAQTITPPRASLRMSEAEIARARAEIQVDRILLAVLDGLRRDASGDGLRAVLLAEVLSGRGVTDALMALGRAASPSSADVARGAPPRVPGEPPVTAAPRPGAVPDDLFARAREEAGRADPAPDPKGGVAPLRAIVERSLASRTPRPVAGAGDGANSAKAAGIAPKGRGGGKLASEVRAVVKRIARATRRPLRVEDVLEGLDPQTRRQVDEQHGAYLQMTLKRCCVRFGKDEYWPMDEPLPDNLGNAEGPPVDVVATLPEVLYAYTGKVRANIEAYNRDMPERSKIRIGPEYKLTSDSKGRSARARRRV